MDSYDVKLDVKKEFNATIDVTATFNTEVSLKVEKDIKVSMDLCELQGNAAVLVFELDAKGDNSLTEATFAILVTDNFSSITGEFGAYVN
jgi:hypothetical protein